MDIQETTANDGTKPPPSPPETSKAKCDAKAYAKGGATKERETRSGMRRKEHLHRKYYHEKLKGEKHCKYCDKLLGSVQSIRKHESRNLLCKIKRLEDEIKIKPYKDIISDVIQVPSP